MSRLLWIIVLAIWIILLTWIWWFFTCNLGASGGLADSCTHMNLKDGTTLDYDGHGSTRFLRSSANLIIPSDYMDEDYYQNNGLATVNNHLIENRGRAVTITGLYESNESNNTGFSDIGLARAENIKQIFLANGVSANQVVTRSNQQSSKCVVGDTLYQRVNFTFGPSN